MAAAAKPLEFLEQLAADKPALAEDLSELSSLYQRKLWHQLTLKLEEDFGKPAFNQGDLLVQLFNGFVADFGAKLNLLRLAHLAVDASKQLKDPAAAVAFLKSAADKLAEWKLPRSDEPLLYLRMHIAQQQLAAGDVAECKAAIEDGAAALERLPEPDPSVSAAVHYASSLYYKLKKDYARFYRSSMQARGACGGRPGGGGDRPGGGCQGGLQAPPWCRARSRTHGLGRGAVAVQTGARRCGPAAVLRRAAMISAHTHARAHAHTQHTHTRAHTRTHTHAHTHTHSTWRLCRATACLKTSSSRCRST
jgi:hypothetical protein